LSIVFLFNDVPFCQGRRGGREERECERMRANIFIGLEDKRRHCPPRRTIAILKSHVHGSCECVNKEIEERKGQGG
jgi:hypothetical protein